MTHSPKVTPTMTGATPPPPVARGRARAGPGTPGPVSRNCSRPLSLLVKRRRPRRGSQSLGDGAGSGLGAWTWPARAPAPGFLSSALPGLSQPQHLRTCVQGAGCRPRLPRGPAARRHGPSLRPLSRQARAGALTAQSRPPWCLALSPQRGWSLPFLSRGTSSLTMAEKVPDSSSLQAK